MAVRPIKRIVVPLDGSVMAEGAIPYACTLAKNHPAEIIFLAVLPDESHWPNQEIRQTLYRAETAARYVASVRLEVAFGDPALQIVEFAFDAAADIIAMTTHGLTGNLRAMHGSVVEQVMLESPIPVSAVKAAEWMGHLDVTRPIDHLILPVDGSWRSLEVEHFATRLAVTLGARVTIYHVKDGVTKPNMDVFRELHGELTRHQINVEFTVHEGEPKEKLRNFAAMFPTSIVVMCSRGPKNIPDRPRGSVADYVLRHGRTPVVVLPATGNRQYAGSVYPSTAA